VPRLSVYFIRASLVYLLLSFTIGGLMLANKGMPISALIWALLPLHIDFAFAGWMIQLAMGVAFWVLPRFPRGAPRGNENLSWWALILINTGILLAVIEYVFHLAGLALIGRVAEILGLITFVLGNWRRIKPFDT
jgi:hypothetical protein